MSNIKREHKKDIQVTIASGETVSEIFDTFGWAFGRVYLPSGFDGTALAVHASPDGTAANLNPAHGTDGSAVAPTVAADQSHRFDGAFPASSMAFVADTQTSGDTVLIVELMG